MTREVITLAIGRPVYRELASNLARSFRRWNSSGEIAFHLVTDQADELDPDLGFVRVTRIRPGELATGFTAKLHVDAYLSADESLLVDTDCLCVGPLGPVFDRFAGRHLAVVGRRVTDGELFGDIAFRCRQAGVPWTVRFCGAVYFLRRGALCSEILAFARSLEPRYEELGLQLLRGVPNEEPLIGLAMGKFGEEPVPEDGSIKADALFYNQPFRCDVLAGRAVASNDPQLPTLLPEWQMPDVARPVILHFNAGFAECPPYTAEAWKLRQVLRGWPAPLARLAAWLRFELPFRFRERMKNVFRPMFRRWFGVRPVRASPRC